MLRGAVIIHLSEPLGKQLERVVPKRVDFYRFTATRGDDPVAHFRVHPGKLITFFALREQPVVGIDVNVEFGSGEVTIGNIDQSRQKQGQGPPILRHFNITMKRVKKPKRRVGRMVEPLFGAIGKHIWDQPVPYVVGEGAKNVAGLEPATGR